VDQNPWFHLRNFRPYGRPEHRNAYGPQQLIHKLIEAQAATIDFQTFPQRYLLMDPKADDFLQNLTDPFNSEDDAEDPEDPGNVTQLRGDPAAIWKLFGARDAGEFSVANPENFLNPVDRYIRMMSETTSTPIYEFGMSEPPSGEALRIAREPLYAKVADRQAAYGPVESDAFEFAFQAKQAAGVPMIEALVEAGYPREQVETWFTGEHAETVDIQRRVDMLATIATAVQGLGAAIALGAVDQSAVKALVARILGDLSPAGFDLAAAAAQTDEGPPPEWSRISTHNVIGQRAGGGGPVGGLATVQDAPGPDAAPAGDQPGQG